MAEKDHRAPKQASHRALGAEVVVATAANQAEADMICARLADAGIAAEARRSIGGPEWGLAGARYVYVEPHALARAKEILDASNDFSDEELARLSEESAAASAARLAAREDAEPPHAASAGKQGVIGKLLHRRQGG